MADGEQSFSEQLREHRLAADLTQAALADRAGISTRSIQALEHGLTRPHRDTLVRLAEALELSAHEQTIFQGAATPRPRQRVPAVLEVSSAPGVVGTVRRSPLPLQLSSFIGRDRELIEVRQLLEHARLVTLTGAGGVGKTRLALQLGEQLTDAYADGVSLVELAPVADPVLLAQTIAAVLGVREHPDEQLAETLVASLEQRHMLLLLDNCEHLVDAVASLAERLLRGCRGVRLLATSREPLRVPGEITWRVPSLAFPDLQRSPDLDEVFASPAVRLFLAHARSVQSGFELTRQNARAVAEVAARLDGLPLAIELAAARMRVLGVEELRDRLDDCFRLLVGGDRTVPGRHRTLQATLDWSNELLTAAEQVVLRRLAVFAGGCDLEGVEAVCSGEPIERGNVLEVLTGLVDKSLVVKTEVGGRARFGQLETVRQYALQKLCDAGEEAPVHRRHAEWCLGLIGRAAPHIQTAEEKHWMTRLDVERNNLRAALAWCAAEGNAVTELGLEMLDVLGYVWLTEQQQTEGRRWIERFLELDRGPARSEHVRVLNWGAEFATQQGDLQRSNTLAEESLRVSREIGYLAGEGVALTRLGTNADTSRLHDHGLTLLDEGLRICLQSGDERSIYYARHKLSNALLIDMQLDAATTLIEDNLALATRRDDRWGIAQAICQLGLVASAREDYGRAARLLDQSLSLWRATGAARGPQAALLELGRVALAQGDPERARSLLGESLRLSRGAWHTRQIALCLHALAGVAAQSRQPTRAATLFGAAAALGERVAVPLPIGPRSTYAVGRAAAQDQLGAAPFDRAWAAGRALALEQALSEAEEFVAGQVNSDEIDFAGAPEPAGPLSVPANSSEPGHLTTRQTEVLRLVAEGKTDRQIAAELVLSEKTVGRHLENIFSRLGVSSRGCRYCRRGPYGSRLNRAADRWGVRLGRSPEAVR